MRLILASVGLAAHALAQNSSITTIPVVDLATGASCACAQLSAQYGDTIVYQNSTNYTAETTNYWDVRSDQQPGCIFFPEDADDVSTGVNIFTSCGAQFAVRGGGHMNVCT